MQHGTRNITTPFAAFARSVAVLVSLCVASVANAQYNVSPQEVKGLEIQDRLGTMLPMHLEFTDSVGKRVRLQQYFDGKKPVIIVMMYLRCPLQCPTIANSVIDAMNDMEFTLGRDYRVLMVSFDTRDTPAQAERERQAAFLQYTRPTPPDVRDGLTYLTSGRLESAELAAALGYPYKFQTKSGEFSHASGIFLATPEGRISRFLNGLKFETKDVRFALIEASEGRIGDVIDRFIHWCFAFDPDSGGYTLAAFRVMRLGATGTAVLLGGLVAFLFANDHRKKRRRKAEAEAAAGGADAGELEGVANGGAPTLTRGGSRLTGQQA